jgi:hypothetical protein
MFTSRSATLELSRAAIRTLLSGAMVASVKLPTTVGPLSSPGFQVEIPEICGVPYSSDFLATSGVNATNDESACQLPLRWMEASYP